MQQFYRERTQRHDGSHGPRYAALIAAVVLAACGSPRMDSAPVQSTDLTGQWLLDRRESDDVRARLQPLIEKAESKWRKVERRMGDRDGDVILVDPATSRPVDGAADNSTLHWIREQRQREAQALIAFVSPASQLDIQQSVREVRFSSDKGEGSRTLVPGEPSSLFVAMGGFDINSGWDGSSFVVESRGTDDNSMRIVERYTLLAQGEQLEEHVDIRLPDLGKQAFRFVYKRKHL